LVAFFNTEERTNKTLFERFSDFINNITNDSKSNLKPDSAMNKFKTNVAFLLAALALSEFTLNAQNKAELSVDELLNLENKYNELNAKATAAEAAATEAKAKLDQEVKALQMELKSTETKLAEMKQAAANRWKEFEASVSAATARLRKSIESSKG